MGVDSYSLKLPWRDTKGNLRTADKVSVRSTFVRPLIRDDRLMLDSVRIKYPADDPNSAPIVLDDDPASKAESVELMATVGIGLAGGGAVGSLIMFQLPRRRGARLTGHEAPA